MEGRAEQRSTKVLGAGLFVVLRQGICHFIYCLTSHHKNKCQVSEEIKLRSIDEYLTSS